MIGWYEIGLEPKYCRTIFPGTSPSVGFCDMESKRRKAETAEPAEPADCLRVHGARFRNWPCVRSLDEKFDDRCYFGAALMGALGSIAAVVRMWNGA